MKSTKLEEYLSTDEADAIIEKLSINSMEQLIALCQTDKAIESIALEISVSLSYLRSVIRTAEKDLGTLNRSSREYPMGAMHPKTKKSSPLNPF
jgi:hypothetical protein